MKELISPKEFFGFEPGSDGHMIHWNDIVRYFEHLNDASPRVKVQHMGLSTEDNDFIVAYISAEKNLEKMNNYREISNRLFDPQGLSKEEIDQLAEEGCAVCMVSMSLHSNEVGGTQCSPGLAYRLAAAEDSQGIEILNNVILILSPCSNPDGEIVFTEWYEKYKGTRYEGCCSPLLRHKYGGHSNNRDGVHNNLVESSYLNSLMMEWAPQAFLDHHHQCSWMDRLTIAPYTNPIFPYVSPLQMRELEGYGAAMASALSKKGVLGVATGDKFFDYWPGNHLQRVSQLQNIAGILAESADALIASPIYISPEVLEAYGDANVIPSAECPEPWPGGWWKLSDIVRQMQIATMALLRYMAHNRKEILENMAFKAIAQTERGRKDPAGAYLIPREQHDISSLNRLLEILRTKKIHFGQTARTISVGAAQYPAGTIVVPLAQPSYALVKSLLGKTFYPDNCYSKDNTGALRIEDMAALNIADCMGIEVIEAKRALMPEQEISPLKMPEGMPAEENESYRLANERITAGEKVFRDEKGDFNLESRGRQVSIPRIALLKLSMTGNSEEGFCRLLMERYGFPYDIVTDKMVQAGALEDYDVFIIPGDTETELSVGRDIDPENDPPEYQSGLKEKGFENLQRFVRRGGRIIAWGDSCVYAAKAGGKPVKDEAKGLKSSEYSTHGSTLRVRYTPCELTYGMPEEGLILHWDGPVLRERDWRLASRYQTFIRFADSDLLSSGALTGEKVLAGKSCAMRVDCETGDVVLFSFDPKFRMQTDATYKLLFNALYRYEK